MDFKMRSFFSKCLVAEFLRRKLNSNAKIFYRPFDTKTGDLVKIEKKDDFPVLIEKVLLTTTGGTSTNLQEAVYQAVEDIRFDKELINAEILVVTDGISKIDKYEMKNKLADIKLNVLKIGDDLAEPNFFEMKKTLEFSKIDFDPSSVNIKEIKKKMAEAGGEADDSVLLPKERRAYRYLLDFSERMFNDLAGSFATLCRDQGSRTLRALQAYRRNARFDRDRRRRSLPHRPRDTDPGGA
ncbi:MAG: hypothetical protein EHM32_03165 [Spirochaetales bacterium]|nr:MAG: hypothetical protein EHM32_03165 [Spirochaetales bacterium]